MSDKTAIEWTSATWNPLIGCTRVSRGCEHCYAERAAWRMAGQPGSPYKRVVRLRNGRPGWTGDVELVEKLLDLPLRWRTPRRIFVNSMSDLFHEKVKDEWIARIFGIMYASRRHTFQILTKRPERMAAWVSRCANGGGLGWITHDGTEPEKAYLGTGIIVGNKDVWPLPNVQLGTSVEDQATFDERVEHLGRTPAALRFLSLEPLLGEIDLGNALDDPPDGSPYGKIGWVIVGGESGPGARPCDLEWIRWIVRQCRAADVACFVKQLGAHPHNEAPSGRMYCWAPQGLWIRSGGCGAGSWSRGLVLRDRKGGDMTEWPADLRVREFPT